MILSHGFQIKKVEKNLAHIFKTGDEIYGILLTPGTPNIYDGARYDFNTVIKSISNIQVSYSTTDILSALIKAKKIDDVFPDEKRKKIIANNLAFINDIKNIINKAKNDEK